jgi:hypothetical protein
MERLKRKREARRGVGHGEGGRAATVARDSGGGRAGRREGDSGACVARALSGFPGGGFEFAKSLIELQVQGGLVYLRTMKWSNLPSELCKISQITPRAVLGGGFATVSAVLLQ